MEYLLSHLSKKYFYPFFMAHFFGRSCLKFQSRSWGVSWWGDYRIIIRQSVCTSDKNFVSPAWLSVQWSQGSLEKKWAGGEGVIENFLPKIDCDAIFLCRKWRRVLHWALGNPVSPTSMAWIPPDTETCTNCEEDITLCILGFFSLYCDLRHWSFCFITGFVDVCQRPWHGISKTNLNE